MTTMPVAKDEVTEPLAPLSSSAADNLNCEERHNEVTDELWFRHIVDELLSKVDELEQKANEVSEFYATKRKNDIKGIPDLKEKEKQGTNSSSNNIANSSGNNSGSKKLVDGSRPPTVCSKRMQELIRQFGTILRQISQHKWAGPFMDPVDVESLGLHDYYKIIKKPMDLSTIRRQLEAKDGACYRNVSDIYADTRLVFTNAMTYNDERDDIHVMAKTLLAKLEEKWLLLWPKVVEEENRQKEEEAHAMANMHVAREAAIGKMASDTDSELNELNMQLEELREMVVQKCRKWSTEEKRKLGLGLSTLSVENLSKALEIITQSNPAFQAFGEVVEFDMDAQSESTLWRLKYFVKEALNIQRKSSAGGSERKKRKKEMCADLTKPDSKRSKKACLSLK